MSQATRKRSRKSKTAPAAGGISRRPVLKGFAALAAAGVSARSIGPFIRDAEEATLKLHWLGWEH